ncbi:MAG: phosphatidate cytidylyltransferase [Bacteroidetes bacterium]|nr:phosphatidate cytidylyltransferase [Bacteroidota bacterium]
MIKNTCYALLFFMTSLFASCQVIGGIFKAGVWVGVLLVVAVIVVIAMIVRGMSKKS